MPNLEVRIDGRWYADVGYGGSYEVDLKPREHTVAVTNKMKQAKAGFFARKGETVVLQGTNVFSQSA